MKKILVVDDEADIVEVVTDRLKAEGFEVISETDGVKGLNRAREEKPDLLILDVMLPNISGYDICRLLKFDAAYRKIPIIMFTAKASNADKTNAENAGADDYIVKPFEPAALMEKVRMHMKK
jgi:DNA-binding response OmpR family regulator